MATLTPASILTCFRLLGFRPLQTLGMDGLLPKMEVAPSRCSTATPKSYLPSLGLHGPVNPPPFPGGTSSHTHIPSLQNGVRNSHNQALTVFLTSPQMDFTVIYQAKPPLN